MRTARRATTALVVAGVVGAGCFFSPDEYPGDYQSTGGSGGMGGNGGAGGSGGAGECTPGVTEACYSGPMGTEGLGICHGGTRMCSDAGEWGACEGEVLPTAEVCATAVDDDCDGQVNEEGADCSCAPGSTIACYTGPAETRGLGLCMDGQQVCNDSGQGYGPCTGEVLPAAEVCGTNVDEDCDGQGWFPDTDCVCEPASTGSCYTGPMGTEGMGICQPGTRTCNADGLGWGGNCVGEVLPTTEVCGNDLDDDCNNARCADALWAVAATGTGKQIVYDLAVDSTGNVIVVGNFTSSITIGSSTFQGNGIDGFVFKLNPQGTVLWAKRFGAAEEQTVRGVAVDGAGNVYITGYFDQSMVIEGITLTTGGNDDYDFFVAKLDPQGDLLWAQDYGTATGSGDEDDQRALGVDVTSQGDVAVTGRFNGSIAFGSTTIASAGGPDVFVARMDATGLPMGIVRFGDASYQVGRAVAIDSGVHVIGEGAGTFSVGSTQLDNGGTPDVIAMRLDPPSPASPWANHFGTGNAYSARGVDIDLDPSGNVLLGGYYNGPIDFGGGTLPYSSPLPDPRRFIAKLDPKGKEIWSAGFAAGLSVLNSYDVTLGVAADSTGNMLLTGDFTGTTTFGGANLTASGTDLFIAKFDPAGAHLWSRRFGNAQAQFGVAVATDPNDDHIVIAGHFLGQIDFGVPTVAANGASNSLQTLFVAKLTP